MHTVLRTKKCKKMKATSWFRKFFFESYDKFVEVVVWNIHAEEVAAKVTYISSPRHYQEF